MTPDQRKFASKVVQAIAETIQEFPEGAPLGPMYAAMMGYDIGLETFQAIIEEMRKLGLIEVRNHCAFWVAGRVQ